MKRIFLLYFLISLNLVSFGQNPADITQSFGANPGFNNIVSSVAIQSDGKMIIGGDFTKYKGKTESRIVRLNNDGTTDTTFNSESGFNSSVFSIAIQPDGKIIVGGNFNSYNGVTENRIIRLNSDGTKDTTFNTGTGFNNDVFSIIVQSDGKIIIGGNFTTYKGVTENRIIRLNSDGTKDTTFNTVNGFNETVRSIALLPNGKIIIGGSFTFYQGMSENKIICLTNDGAKDIGFNIGTGFNNDIYSIVTQPDGKIIVGGDFTTYNGIIQNRIIRLNSDGNKDITFNTGIGFNNRILSMKIQSDGKIIISGWFTSFNGSTENYIILLNSDGTKDTFFNSSTSNGFAESIALESNGKIILVGNFTTYNGLTENRIIRLNADGTKDTSLFAGNGFNGTIFSMIMQPDGKIVIGGLFTSYKGEIEKNIIRLNADGTKDTSFNTGTGFETYVVSLVLQPDGKIIVGGYFNQYNGVVENYIVRLNSDGSKDNTFNTGSGFNGYVNTIKLQPDGKIIVGGNFDTYKGLSQKYIIRLNSDGTKDTSFSTGFNRPIYSIALQPDGKIIAGGAFFNYFGINENYIIRLNSNGSKDTTFNTGIGFNNHVQNIEPQPNGKIIVGGDFTSYQNVTENHIIRLNSDGTKDTSFNTGSGFNSPMWTSLVKSDGKIILGGGFTTYKGDNNSASLVVLNGDSLLSNESFVNQNDISLWPNPTQKTLNISILNNNISSISIYNVEGKLIYENENINSFIDVSDFASGLYLVKFRTEEGEFTKKFIKE